MQLINKFNEGFRFLLCAINIYKKFAWVVTSSFHQISDEFNRKPNKIWVDRGNKFYNRSITSWLQDNDIEIYSTHNKEKFVVAERFIRNLQEQSL